MTNTNGNDIDEDFLKTIISWGIIIRADVGSISKIKQLIKSLPDAQIVYQTTSAGRLRIVKEDERVS